MKKYLLSFFLLFALINGFAQIDFNKAYHSKHETPNSPVLSVFEDYYFLTANASVEQYGFCNLYKHDKNGNLIYSKNQVFLGSHFALRAIRTLDNKLVYMGYQRFCDVPDTSYLKSFITKLDTAGNPIFYTKVKTSWANPNVVTDHFKTGIQHSDSSFYVFSDSIMFRFSKTGQYTLRKNLGLTNISSSILLQNGNCLLSAGLSGTNSLVQVNSTGNIVAQTTINKLFTKMEFYGGQKLIGSNQKLFKISDNYALIDSSSFGTGNNSIDFTVSNDTIYTISNYNATQKYTVADTLLNIISQSTTNTQRITQTSLCKKNERVCVLNNALSTPNINAENNYTGINVFNKTGSNNFSNDAQVLSISTNSANISCTVQLIPMSTITVISYSTNFKADVWVRNNGSSVLSSVKLNCFDRQSQVCGYIFYQKLFTGIAVNPGDSVMLTTDFIGRFFYGNTSVLPAVVTQSYCIYTTLPNSENDKNISNDGLCITVPFYPVSVKELFLDETKFNVFPNPFENVVNVESEIDVKQVKIFNLIGELITNVLVNNKKVKIVTNELPQGIYFLKIETGNGILIKKIIKE